SGLVDWKGERVAPAARWLDRRRLGGASRADLPASRWRYETNESTTPQSPAAAPAPRRARPTSLARWGDACPPFRGARRGGIAGIRREGGRWQPSLPDRGR